jgi:hypothetical protein
VPPSSITALIFSIFRLPLLPFSLYIFGIDDLFSPGRLPVRRGRTAAMQHLPHVPYEVSIS